MGVPPGPGQAVSQKALGAEPAEHRRSREGGKVPQRLDAQAYQQVGQGGDVRRARELAEGAHIGAGEHPDREGGQELSAASSGHNQRSPGRRQLGGQSGRKKPVGDAHPATTAPAPPFPSPEAGRLGDHGFDRGGDLGRQGRVPSEIARGPTGAEGEPARSEHLYAGGEGFHCGYGRLPASDLGRHVPGHHLEARATALGLTPAQAYPGTSSPGGW